LRAPTSIHVEQRQLAAVVLHPGQDGRHEPLCEGAGPLVRLARIDDHPAGVLVEHVAQHTQREAQVFMHQRWRGSSGDGLLDRCPERAQVADIVGQFTLGRGLGDGTDDEAAMLVRGAHALDHLAQVVALRLVLDAL